MKFLKKIKIISIFFYLIFFINTFSKQIRYLSIIIDPECRNHYENAFFRQILNAMDKNYPRYPLLISTALLTNDVEQEAKKYQGIVIKTNIMTLFIPSEYIKFLQEESINLKIENDFQLCGFNKNLRVFGKDNEEKTLNFIQNLLLNNINNEKITWVIYLAGHGYYAKQLINKPKLEQTAIDDEDDSICSIIINQEYLKKLDEEKKKKENEKVERQKRKQLFPTSQEIIKNFSEVTNTEEPVIAGFKLTNFIKLLKFFNGQENSQNIQQSINVGLLSYISCFSGGYNRQIIEKILKEISFQGYVLTFGLGENSIKPMVTYFSKFFEKAKKIVISQDQKQTEKKESEEYKHLFQSLPTEIRTDSNYAFWYNPNRKAFEKCTYSPYSFNLTEFCKRFHEIAKKEINATLFDTLLIDPIRIMSKIKLSWGSTILNTQKDSQNSLRFFNNLEISTPRKISAANIDLFGFLLQTATVYPQLILIKNLSCPVAILKSFPQDQWPTKYVEELMKSRNETSKKLFDENIRLENVIIYGAFPGIIYIGCAYENRYYKAIIEIGLNEIYKAWEMGYTETYINEKISREIKFKPLTETNLDTDFSKLYNFIQLKELSKYGDEVTQSKIKQDNEKYGISWA